MSGPAYRGLPDRAAPLDVRALGDEGGRPPLPAGTPPAPPIGRSVELYLPTVFPIPGATEFFRSTFASSPAAGTIVPAGLVFEIPEGSIGIIRVFGAGLDDMTNATDVRFRLRVNGAPVPAWGDFQIFPGVAARVTSSADTWVELGSGARIDVAIENIDGAAYVVGANYSGWYWPEPAGLAWMGELWRIRGEPVQDARATDFSGR